MADTTLNVKIKNRYDTEANWSSNNPVLLKGELAISSDKNGMYKVGDGTSTWSALSYNTASSCTGNSATATALTTSAGSATQPIYFSSGKPVACTYALNKTVPSDAVFTDTNTHYASGTIVNNSTTATSNTSTALTNGNVYLNHIENGAVKNSHKISGSGATTVTTDASGNIIVSSTDNNTDTKVTNTLGTTTKAYVTGTTSSSTNTGTQIFDTGVYLDTTAGRLTVSSLKIGSGILSWDSTNNAIVISV